MPVFSRTPGSSRPQRPTTNLVTQSIRRATTAPARQTSLTQETVSCYELPWDVLHAWLVARYPSDKYPKLGFREEKVRCHNQDPDATNTKLLVCRHQINNDHYVFMVPELFTPVCRARS